MSAEVMIPKTTMTSQVMFITPQVAKDLLKRNVENRKTRTESIAEMAKMMESGKWKENGESIIIDSNGVFKDGQHRLHAAIKAKHSFWSVVVKGVNPDVMDTIDTGINRTLADVLHLNGYKRAVQSAATVKSMIRFNISQQKNTLASGKITNGVGFGYFLKHEDRIKSTILAAQRPYQRSPKILKTTFLTTILHVITKGKTPTDQHEEFIKRLCGVVVEEKTAAAWFYRTLRNAKKDKTRLNEYWKWGIVIKCWNNFVQGDPAVQYMKFDVNANLPKVL